jgi:parallel beta-helix repeat protein
MWHIFIYFLLTVILAPTWAQAQSCVVITTLNISSINSKIKKLSQKGGGCVEIATGNYTNVPNIVLQSNIVLKIYGKLNRSYNIIDISGCENVTVIGYNAGSLNCITSQKAEALTAKGVMVENSRNINIESLTITGFQDKGILIKGPNSSNVKIRDNTISGATSTTGIGIAVTDLLLVEGFGGVGFCLIESNTTFGNRIGISVNKSQYISIQGNHSYGNDIHGIGLDGLEDGNLGDGPQNCIITANQVYNNGGTCISGEAKCGIYLGNGSSKNIISNNIVRNNRCNGILHFEFSDNLNSAYNNSIVNNQVISNYQWGIRLVNSNRGIISNNQVIGNGTEKDGKAGGIQLDHSHSNIVTSNNVILNGEHGINVKGSTGNEIHSNITEGQPVPFSTD